MRNAALVGLLDPKRKKPRKPSILPPPSQPDARLRALKKQMDARIANEAFYWDQLGWNGGN